MFPFYFNTQFPLYSNYCKICLVLLFCWKLAEELNSINSDNLSNIGETASSGGSGDNGDEWDSDLPAGVEMELSDMSGVRYDAREQLLSPEIQEEASYQYGQ